MNLHFITFLAQYGYDTGQRTGGGIGMGYLLIIGATLLVSFLVSGTLKRRFAEYSQIPIRMTGAQIAEMMLRQNGITDVRVASRAAMSYEALA